jgi:hypothetical protein
VSRQKQQRNKKKTFHQQTGLLFKEETSRMLNVGHSFVWCWNLDSSESRSEMAGNFLKCGAGEGWRSAGQIVWEMKYYKESKRSGMSYKQKERED